MSEPDSSKTSPPEGSIVGDLRKMAPIWGLIALAAFGSLMAIRYNGRQYLERGIFSQANACEIARVHMHAAERVWRSIAAELAAEHTRGQSSLGAFSDDPRVAMAIDKLEEAIELCDHLAGAHSYRADFAWWQGDTAGTHLHQGLEHLVMQEWDDGLVELEAAFLTDPQELRASEGILRVHLMRGELDRAEEFLELAPEAVRESGRGLQARAFLLEDRDDVLGARELYRRALEHLPGDRILMQRFLSNHIATGEDELGADEAMRVLSQARAVPADPYHAVALTYGNVGEFRKALEAIDRALAIQPNSAALLMEKSALLYELGREPEARAAAREALQRDPGFFAREVHADRFRRLRQQGQ